MTRTRDQRGSATIEAVVGAMGFAAFLGLIYYGGQIALAEQTVQAAAAEAARSASIARSQGAAQSAGFAAAQQVINNHGLDCDALNVQLDTSAFGLPIGTPGEVVAVVTCHVSSAQIATFYGGGVQVQKTMSSPVDTYRPRG